MKQKMLTNVNTRDYFFNNISLIFIISIEEKTIPCGRESHFVPRIKTMKCHAVHKSFRQKVAFYLSFYALNVKVNLILGK